MKLQNGSMVKNIYKIQKFIKDTVSLQNNSHFHSMRFSFFVNPELLILPLAVQECKTYSISIFSLKFFSLISFFFFPKNRMWDDMCVLSRISFKGGIPCKVYGLLFLNIDIVVVIDPLFIKKIEKGAKEQIMGCYATIIQ